MLKLTQHLSRLMGKPTICIGEIKDADQLRGNREADQRLCFCYSDSTIPPLLKCEISSFWLFSVTVQVGLCQTCSETTLLVFPRGVRCNICISYFIMTYEKLSKHTQFICIQSILEGIKRIVILKLKPVIFSLGHTLPVRASWGCSTTVYTVNEPHHEKTGFLPKRKQRLRSASQ